MSSLSHCPHCQQQVAIPDGTDPFALVRCPHCHAEFPLTDTSADRADGPPDVILVTPPPVEAAPAALPSSEVSPETARLDQESLELAEEASGLQSRAEGLQVTAHTSDLEPEAAATRAEALEHEAQALAAQVEAIADPMEAIDQPTARPVMVVGAYRAMGGALVATADALDALADVIQHNAIASQPEPSQQTPLAELGSDLATAVGVGEHHDQSDDQEIHLDPPESILEDEAPLPMSDAELFFADAEPAAVEPAATEAVPAQPAAAETVITEPAATEPVAAEPAPAQPAATEPAPAQPAAATEPAATEPAAMEPVAAEPAATEPMPAEPAAAEQTVAAESPGVDGGPGLLKAVNLRSRAEALRARGEGLLAKADAVAAAFGVPAEDEAGEDGGGGEYALHGDWAAGQPAGAATAAGGAALPFPVIARKQREPKNPVRQFIAILLGMLTAFVLTYLILNLVSAEYDWFGIRPKWLPQIMKSETTAQPAANQSPKASKPGKQAGAVPGKNASSPGASGQGSKVAKAGSEKQPSGKAADALPDLPEAKPTPLDSSSGDTVPTTLPSGDMLPGPAATPSKPVETESPPPPADAKFGNVADMAKPPAYGSADLGWALKSAQDAFQGDLKATNYASLCRLGEVLTFIDPQKGVTDLPSQKIAVEKLLRDVGNRDKHKNVKIIAQLADKWLDNAGRENPGVLLAGRIQKIGHNSAGTTIDVISLAKPDPKAPAERTIKLVSREPLSGFQEKDAVIILGGLAVGGHGDQRELVVWHGVTVRFAVPPAKGK